MFFKLLWLLIKANIRPASKRTGRSIGMIIASIFGILVLFGLFLPISIMAFNVIEKEQSVYILGAITVMVLFLSVMFGLRVAYGLLGASRDLPFLLSLPLKSSTIFAARISLGYLSELGTVLMMMLPFVIGYLVVYGTITSVFSAILVLLLMPIISLTIATLLTLILLRISKVFHIGEGFFMVINTMLTIALTVGISLFSQKISMGSSADMSNMLSGFIETAAHVSSSFLPALWAAEGIVRPFQGGFWLFVLLNIILGAFTCYLGGRLYRHGSQMTVETKGKKKKKQGLHNNVRQKSLFGAIIQKDIRVIMRSPTFAMNLFSLLIAGPIAVFAMSFSWNSASSGTAANDFMNLNGSIGFYMIFGFVFFIGSLNTIASTAMSREGRAAWIDLIMPVTAQKQITAKLLLAMIVGLIESLVLICIFVFVMKVSLSVAIWGGIAGIAASFAPQIICALPDLWHPKLKWESEREAMKNNFNALIGMLFSLLLVIPHVILFVILRDSLRASVIGSIILSVLELTIVFILMPRISKKALAGWQQEL